MSRRRFVSKISVYSLGSIQLPVDYNVDFKV